MMPWWRGKVVGGPVILDVKITSWWAHLGSRLERMPADYPASRGRGLTIIGTTHLDKDTRAFAHVSLHQGVSPDARDSGCVGFLKTRRPIDIILDAHLGCDADLWNEVGTWLRTRPGVGFLKLWLPDGSSFEDDDISRVLDFEFQLEFKAEGRR